MQVEDLDYNRVYASVVKTVSIEQPIANASFHRFPGVPSEVVPGCPDSTVLEGIYWGHYLVSQLLTITNSITSPVSRYLVSVSSN